MVEEEKKTEEDVEPEVITADLRELEDKLEELGEKQEELLSSGGRFSYLGPTAADAVVGFATYLTSVKTFRAGTRGDATKLVRLANKFCEAMGFGTPSENFPGNIKFPE